MLEQLNYIELASLRRWMKRRGYSEGTIRNVISNLNRMMEEKKRILAPDEAKEEYWGCAKELRHWRRYAAKIYEEYRKKVKRV